MSTHAEDVDASLIRSNRLDLVERIADDLAHEIKNPLHSMVINLEVLRRRVASAESAAAGDMMRYVEVLDQELDRVNRGIDTLLRLLRPPRAGEAMPLGDLLQESRTLIDLEASRRGIRLSVEPFTSDSALYLPRDAARQLLLNLLLVGLDSLPDGGALVLRAERDAAAIRIVVSGNTSATLARAARANGSSSGGSDAHRSPHRLEIVERLGDALGGRLTTSEAEDGFTLVFELPREG